MISIDPSKPLNGGIFSESHAMFALHADWVAEPKWDGHRCIVTQEGAYSRHGKPMPRAQPFVQGLKCLFEGLEQTILWIDGELLGPRDGYEHDFLVVFDFYSTVPMPWGARRIMLQSALNVCDLERPRSPGIALTPVSQNPHDLWSRLQDLGGAEGIVCKQFEKPYLLGRNTDWIKFRFSEQP